MSNYIIKLTPSGEITTPEWKEENQYIRSLIGEKCDMYEHVRPNRLYTELGCLNHIDTKAPGRCVSMLVDEEGLYHNLPTNVVASWLYETDKHGYDIVGTVLFVGETFNNGEPTFCALDDMAGLSLLTNLSQAVSLLKKLDIRGEFFQKEGKNV